MKLIPMDDLCATCWGNERACVCEEPDYVPVYRVARPGEENEGFDVPAVEEAHR